MTQMTPEISIRFEEALTTRVEYISTAHDENSSSLVTTMTSPLDSETTSCANIFCVSDEDYLDMIRDFIFPTPFEWVLIGFYVVVFVIGMVGNFLVCFVVWVDHKMRTVTNLFIVNLSVADFLVLLVCLPTTVLADVTETWYMGEIMCKIVQYFQGVSVSVSVLTLSVISIERFYAICHPLQFKATARRAKLIICFIWIASLLILLPDAIVLDTHPRFPIELTVLLTGCNSSWKYQLAYQFFLSFALFLLPLGLMAVAYVRIAVCLWSTAIPSEVTGQMTASRTSAARHQSHRQSPSPTSSGAMMGDGGEGGRGGRGLTSRMTSSSAATTDRHSQVLSRRKVAKMLIAVVLMFAVCYLPVHLLNILRYVKALADESATHMALIAHWLCYFNSAVNPVIYNFMSEKFQKAFRVILLCSLRRGRGSHQTTRLIEWNNASRNASNATTRIHKMTTFV